MSNFQTIYAVEDNQSISDLYKLLLCDKYNIETFVTAEAMLTRLEVQSCDLIIMDVLLPPGGMNGIDAIKVIKKSSKFRNIPCIIVSAKGDTDSKVLGLGSGADDYLGKPFVAAELEARIEANLRKITTTYIREQSKPDLVLDASSKTISIKGKKLKLAVKEYELLKTLIENENTALTRDYLFNEVWGYKYIADTRTLDMHIGMLRKKIAEHTDKEYIITVRSVGYKFVR